MNERDERGWRIPKKGTKSSQVYDLLLAGFRPGEIARMFQEKPSNIGVLIYNIKHSEMHNKRSNIFYKANRYELNEKSMKKRAEKRVIRPPAIKKEYSRYVLKLAYVLKISLKEAVELERKELEKAK